MKVAIASGKGGTGKTTLSVNLAVCLAARGPVVLVDLDVEEPNSGLFLRGELHHREPKYKEIPRWEPEHCTLCGNCQAVCNFNAILTLPDQVMIFPEICHSCHACSELCPTASLPMQPQVMGELTHTTIGGLEFVESCLVIGEEQAVPLIKQTLDYVEHTFPAPVMCLLDSPPGTSCPVIEATRSADLVLLVTEPTPFGLHDLKLAVDTMRHLGRPFAVVLNRHGIGDDQIEHYCATEGIDLVARIPNSRAIAETCSAGGLLYPQVPAVKEAVDQVAGYIAAHTPEVTP